MAATLLRFQVARATLGIAVLVFLIEPAGMSLQLAVVVGLVELAVVQQQRLRWIRAAPSSPDHSLQQPVEAMGARGWIRSSAKR